MPITLPRPDRDETAARVRAAVAALNEALIAAQDANLRVEIEAKPRQQFGRRSVVPQYHCDILEYV